jgi:dipeptidyl aminopeptidase/acylaminoacyl peptidase
MDYYTTRPDLRLLTVEMMGGTPDQIPDRYHRASPIHFIDQIKGKLLIIQGMNDPNVTPENMAAIEDRLMRADIPYEKLIFNDEGHGIRLTANQQILYRRLADFFDNALRKHP